MSTETNRLVRRPACKRWVIVDMYGRVPGWFQCSAPVSADFVERLALSLLPEVACFDLIPWQWADMRELAQAILLKPFTLATCEKAGILGVLEQPAEAPPPKPWVPRKRYPRTKLALPKKKPKPIGRPLSTVAAQLQQRFDSRTNAVPKVRSATAGGSL